MRVGVRFALPDGRFVWVGNGGLIGRLLNADLHLADPQISEAHAMVSLRGLQLRLLALRGRFALDGKPLASLALKEGMKIELRPRYLVEVLEVVLPEKLPAIQTEYGNQILLSVTSLFERGHVELEHGWKPNADQVIWPVGDRWHSKEGELTEGQVLKVGRKRAIFVSVTTKGTPETKPAAEFSAPLVLTLRFDTVHISRSNLPTTVIKGQSAKILTELGLAAAPLSWESLAHDIWGAQSLQTLRSRWDVQLSRLRRQLRENNIRTDLIHSAGFGLVELVLQSHDQVIDES